MGSWLKGESMFKKGDVVRVIDLPDAPGSDIENGDVAVVTGVKAAAHHNHEGTPQLVRLRTFRTLSSATFYWWRLEHVQER